MDDDRYSIRLVARNEGVKYVDDIDTYRFNVGRFDRVWRIYLPCTKGPDYEVHELEKEEEKRILPRIIKYLERIKWFGIFPVRYSVVIERTKATTS